MLRLHKRHFYVQKAGIDLSKSLQEWWDRHPDLTYNEVLSLFTSEIQSTAMYALRAERHPTEDCDYKGDEQCDNPECLAAVEDPRRCVT